MSAATRSYRIEVPAPFAGELEAEAQREHRPPSAIVERIVMRHMEIAKRRRLAPEDIAAQAERVRAADEGDDWEDFLND